MEKEVLDLIKNDVNEQSKLVIDEINYEINKLHDEQINHFKDGLLKERDTYLEKELNDLKVFAVTQASKAKLATKHKLLNLRQELVNSLFNEVEEELIDFTKTKDYQNYIENKLSQIKINDGYLICKEEDIKLINQILKDNKINVDIKKGYLKIGGFKYISITEGIEYDYSLDTNFSEEKEWFVNNSLFTIKE